MALIITRFFLTTLKAFTCHGLITETGYNKTALKIPDSTGESDVTGKYVTIGQRQADGSLKIKAELQGTLPLENIQAIY